jgi:aspartate/methionine/tyrosine aminotransferase
MNLREDAPMFYMAWAKLSAASRFNLATSGVMDYPLAELPARIDDLEINGPGRYGYPPLQECLAKKTGAPAENIVASIGTSMANFIAFSALIERGDEVLIEHPTYQPMLDIVSWLGANVRRFERPAGKGFRLDLDELARQTRPTTKLIVLANLHNPSSTFIEEDLMRQVGELAKGVGARVLVDEVYLETLFDEPWRSAFFLGDNFIVTSSLTKAYGLSGLRCGWILTPADLVQRMWTLVDLTYGIPAHAAERLSVIALNHLAPIAERARILLERNRPLLNSFLAAHEKQLDVEPSRLGTTVAPRLRAGRVDNFCDLLRNEFETTVVPGHFFEEPEYFRIGIGGPTDILEQGLARISEALQHFNG